MTRYERWEVHDAESIHWRFGSREQAERYVRDFAEGLAKDGVDAATIPKPRVVHLVERLDSERAIIEAARAFAVTGDRGELLAAVRRLCDEGLRIG